MRNYHFYRTETDLMKIGKIDYFHLGNLAIDPILFSKKYQYIIVVLNLNKGGVHWIS